MSLFESVAQCLAYLIRGSCYHSLNLSKVAVQGQPFCLWVWWGPEHRSLLSLFLSWCSQSNVKSMASQMLVFWGFASGDLTLRDVTVVRSQVIP